MSASPPRLFTPIQLAGLTLPNRIVIAPMCQFSAEDGSATDWHVIHLGALALSGAGLLILEATGVEPRGRISRECLGLYSDANEAALARVLATLRRYSDMPIGIQLGHAGRKASVRKPGDGRGMAPMDEGGWQTVAPSAIAFGNDWRAPTMLDRAGMEAVIAAFVQATRRSDRLGLDLIELHGAHGYLMSSFLSRIANQRSDEFGGALAGRMRFPLAIFDAVRGAWPAGKPLGVRFNGTDWDERGINPDEAVEFAAALKARGCDYVDVSSGGNCYAEIPLRPGYQVPFAARVKAEVGIATMAVGLIRDPHHAEAILTGGEADMIAIARGILNDLRWPWHAAEDLGVTIPGPAPYERAMTRSGMPAHDTIPKPVQGTAAAR